MDALTQYPELTALIAKLPALSEATGITALGGGLTNKNYRIDAGRKSYVMRVSDPASSLLGIDREKECINTGRAHEAGVGPAVAGFLPNENVLLINWIEAKTLQAKDFQTQPALLPRIAHALQVLHAGPAFNGYFHFPTIRNKYLKTVLAANYFLPDKYLKIEPLVAALEKKLAASKESLVPCNNDLLAENFLDDGEKIWIIDYEYSGQNEASFEIGNLASENALTDEQLTVLCDAYWKKNDPSKIARAKAWSIVARFGWVLWASIQEAISPIPFDFRTWGMQKWNSVLPELQGESYQQVLNNLKNNNDE